jgi:hypothetical protein
MSASASSATPSLREKLVTSRISSSSNPQSTPRSSQQDQNGQQNGHDNNDKHQNQQDIRKRSWFRTYVEWAKSGEKKSEIKWTLFDDRRILSLDDLHSRMRDYHVVNTPPLQPYPQASEIFEREFECAFQFVHVKSPSPRGQGGSQSPGLETVKKVSVGTMTKTLAEELCENNYDVSQTSLLWVHIVSCSCIPTILAHFQVSHMFQLYFGDERPHSSFISSSTELMLTLMSFRLAPEEQALLNKIYIYIRGNLCITYEMDPVPSLEQQASILMERSSRVDSSNDAQPPRSPQPDALFSMTSQPDHWTPQEQYPQQYVVAGEVLNRIINKTTEVREPTRLLYELAAQNLLIQSSLLDFCALSIFYFRNKLNQKQFEMIQYDADRKVRVVELAVMLLKSFANDAETAIEAANLDYSFVIQGKTAFSSIYLLLMHLFIENICCCNAQKVIDGHTQRKLLKSCRTQTCLRPLRIPR